VGYRHNCVMPLIILMLKLFYRRNIFQELLVGCFQRIVIPLWRGWVRVSAVFPPVTRPMSPLWWQMDELCSSGWMITDRGKPKWWVKSLPHSHFVRLKSHMMIEPRPPRWEAWLKKAETCGASHTPHVFLLCFTPVRLSDDNCGNSMQLTHWDTI
jgi:hypothetical protein